MLPEPSLSHELNLLLIHENDPWPQTARSHGRLIEKNSGAAIVLVVPKQRVKEDRSLGLLRWWIGSEKQVYGRSQIFTPELWALDTTGAKLSPHVNDGSIPIVNAVADVLSALANVKPIPQRVVVLLPSDDLDLATDARLYRVELDGLLSRLRAAGVLQTILISPFKYGSNDAHRAALWNEVHGAAALYGGLAVDPVDWMSERYWRADPGVSGVDSSVPNDAGRKMIEQALADLIK